MFLRKKKEAGGTICRGNIDRHRGLYVLYMESLYYALKTRPVGSAGERIGCKKTGVFWKSIDFFLNHEWDGNAVTKTRARAFFFVSNFTKNLKEQLASAGFPCFKHENSIEQTPSVVERWSACMYPVTNRLWRCPKNSNQDCFLVAITAVIRRRISCVEKKGS